MPESETKSERSKKPFVILLILSCSLLWLGYALFYLNEEPTAEKALRDGIRGEKAEEYIWDRNYARTWGSGIGFVGLSGIFVAFRFLKNKTGSPIAGE